MTISRCLTATVLLFTVTSSIFAAPRHIYDDQNRLVLVIEDDGTMISYSYDDENKRVRNSNDTGEAVDYSPNGGAAVRQSQ